MMQSKQKSVESYYSKFGKFMSRLGKKPITLPKGTEVTVSNGLITVKGPQGTLTRKIHPLIEILVQADGVKILPKKETPESSVLWGTWSSHIFNMIEGVNKHFEKRLLIEGVGYKADVKGNEIVFNVGFSHQVTVKIPEGLKVVSDKNGILVSGPDIEVVGDFSARIRSVKKPEPYKGKGIRYSTETIKRKQGKKTV
jgi:large subunit ribosomal protein L6